MEEIFVIKSRNLAKSLQISMVWQRASICERDPTQHDGPRERHYSLADRDGQGFKASVVLRGWETTFVMTVTSSKAKGEFSPWRCPDMRTGGADFWASQHPAHPSFARTAGWRTPVTHLTWGLLRWPKGQSSLPLDHGCVPSCSLFRWVLPSPCLFLWAVCVAWVHWRLCDSPPCLPYQLKQKPFILTFYPSVLAGARGVFQEVRPPLPLQVLGDSLLFSSIHLWSHLLLLGL